MCTIAHIRRIIPIGIKAERVQSVCNSRNLEMRAIPETWKCRRKWYEITGKTIPETWNYTHMQFQVSGIVITAPGNCRVIAVQYATHVMGSIVTVVKIPRGKNTPRHRQGMAFLSVSIPGFLELMPLFTYN